MSPEAPAPCPFCGRDYTLVAVQKSPGLYVVACASCEANGPPCTSEAAAFSDWNRRAPTPDVTRLTRDLEAVHHRWKRIARLVSGRKGGWRAEARFYKNSAALVKGEADKLRAELEEARGALREIARMPETVDDLAYHRPFCNADRCSPYCVIGIASRILTPPSEGESKP